MPILHRLWSWEGFFFLGTLVIVLLLFLMLTLSQSLSLSVARTVPNIMAQLTIYSRNKTVASWVFEGDILIHFLCILRAYEFFISQWVFRPNNWLHTQNKTKMAAPNIYLSNVCATILSDSFLAQRIVLYLQAFVILSHVKNIVLIKHKPLQSPLFLASLTPNFFSRS